MTGELSSFFHQRHVKSPIGGGHRCCAQRSGARSWILGDERQEKSPFSGLRFVEYNGSGAWECVCPENQIGGQAELSKHSCYAYPIFLCHFAGPLKNQTPFRFLVLCLLGFCLLASTRPLQANMPSADAGGLAQLTAAELEFIAEDQLIEIVPKFKHGPLHLIQGDFGPFVPQARAKVPLWLAITLKKRQK